MTTTHTYAVVEIPMAAYRVIRGRLEEAGYSEQIHTESRGDTNIDECPEVIDMHGLALRADVCQHDPSDVVADVMEGDAGELGVQWCRACGAYRRTGEAWEGEWREPGI